MSPVPADPYSNFVNGVDVADGDKVDARFLELYRALNPAVVGLDEANVSLGLLRKLGLNDVAQSQAGRGAIATAAAQAMNANVYGSLATPDRISNLYVPPNGLVEISYYARYQATVTDGTGQFAGVAVHVDGSPMQQPFANTYQTPELDINGTGVIATHSGHVGTDAVNHSAVQGILRTLATSAAALAGSPPAAGFLTGLWVPIDLPAGTHTIEVMWRYITTKASGGTVQDRRLRARVWGP